MFATGRAMDLKQTDTFKTFEACEKQHWLLVIDESTSNTWSYLKMSISKTVMMALLKD